MVVRNGKVVTSVARDLGVLPREGERRASVVEALELEAFDAVALGAVDLERARRAPPPRFVVHVVVTRNAEPGQRFVAHREARALRKRSPLQTVALFAMGVLVFSEKRKACVAIVLERHVLGVEALGDVTRLALRRELTEVRVDVTRATRALERLVPDRRSKTRGKRRVRLHAVAVLAGNLDVFSRQGIAASFVLEAHRLEAFDPVTAPAVLVELAEVGLVTVAVTALFKSEPSELLAFVASGAFDARVFSFERESGAVVIDAGRAPAALVVAPPAVAPQTRLVWISMTVGTLRETQSLPLLVRVTPLAGDPPVGTREGKRRPRVVERNIGERYVEPVTP